MSPINPYNKYIKQYQASNVNTATWQWYGAPTNENGYDPSLARVYLLKIIMNSARKVIIAIRGG